MGEYMARSMASLPHPDSKEMKGRACSPWWPHTTMQNPQELSLISGGDPSCPSPHTVRACEAGRASYKLG